MKRVLASLALAALVVAGCNTQTSVSKGKEGKELKLTSPKTVAVEQGATMELKIAIERKGFDDVVAIKFGDRPEGVTIEDGKLDKGVTEKTFVVKVAPGAKVGKNAISVDATVADMKDHNEITLEVQEKKTTDALKQKRDELTSTVQGKMKDIDAQMKVLQDQAKVADAKTKVEINSQIEKLETQRKALNAEFGRMASATADTWQDYSTRLTSAANDLHNGVTAAVKKLKKD